MMLEEDQTTRGYLLKYPSEGSNRLVCDSQDFPAKCNRCNRSWASDAMEMARHRTECDGRGEEDSMEFNYGIPRLVWFEINSGCKCLQWRESPEAEQTSVWQLPLDSVLQISTLQACSFVVETKTRRQMILEAKDLIERDHWIENLKPFCPEQKAEQLIQAISRGNTNRVTQFLSEEPNLVLAVDEEANNLFLVACKAGAGLDMFATLVAAGVDCDAMNVQGETVLITLCAANEVQIVEFLISNAPVTIDLQSIDGFTALHAAATSGGAQVVSLLVHAGANIFLQDQYGRSPLHFAAACSAGVDAVNALCEVDETIIDLQDYAGNTALHTAAEYGNHEVLLSLLQTAADPTVENSHGLTALSVAQEQGHFECIDILKEYVAFAQERPIPRPFLVKQDYYDDDTGLMPILIETCLAQSISPLNALVNPQKSQKFVLERQKQRSKRRRKLKKRY